MCGTHRALDAARSPAEICDQPQDLFWGPSVDGSIPQCSLAAGHIGVEQGGSGWIFRPAFLTGPEHKQQKIDRPNVRSVKITNYQPRYTKHQLSLTIAELLLLNVAHRAIEFSSHSLQCFRYCCYLTGPGGAGHDGKTSWYGSNHNGVASRLRSQQSTQKPALFATRSLAVFRLRLVYYGIGF